MKKIEIITFKLGKRKSALSLKILNLTIAVAFIGGFVALLFVDMSDSIEQIVRSTLSASIIFSCIKPFWNFDYTKEGFISFNKEGILILDNKKKHLGKVRWEQVNELSVEYVSTSFIHNNIWDAFNDLPGIVLRSTIHSYSKDSGFENKITLKSQSQNLDTNIFFKQDEDFIIFQELINEKCLDNSKVQIIYPADGKPYFGSVKG